ncbi:hypothetical protein CN169_27990, partial [Sinorhizobium meliloti]
WGRHHLGIRGRLFLGIGGRDHFGIRGRIASEFAGRCPECRHPCLPQGRLSPPHRPAWCVRHLPAVQRIGYSDGLQPATMRSEWPVCTTVSIACTLESFFSCGSAGHSVFPEPSSRRQNARFH